MTNIVVRRSKDIITLIFYKVLFWLDDFQPGQEIFESDTPGSLQTIAKMTGSKIIHTAQKRTESGSDPVINMMMIDDGEGERGVILEFCKFTDKPKIIIKESDGTGVAFAGDDGCRELREGPDTEEKEAFEFFIGRINEIVAECTGND